MMLWKTLALTGAALLTMAAAPQAPAPKMAPKPAAASAKPAPVKATPAPVPDFDARYPASVVALLNLGGGKAQIAHQEEDSVLVTVNSVAANFTLQFIGCTPQGRGCKGVQFDSIVEQPGPTFAQLNAFNQTTLMCRGYEDKSGRPHVVYATLLFADDSFDHFRTEVSAWEGCIGEFHNFLKDPNAYLASAP
jgi:hypothetical protein